jgi:hypothetical protein
MAIGVDLGKINDHTVVCVARSVRIDLPEFIADREAVHPMDGVPEVRESGGAPLDPAPRLDYAVGSLEYEAAQTSVGPAAAGVRTEPHLARPNAEIPNVPPTITERAEGQKRLLHGSYGWGGPLKPQ